jgi:hypothetical protein
MTCMRGMIMVQVAFIGNLGLTLIASGVTLMGGESSTLKEETCQKN